MLSRMVLRVSAVGMLLVFWGLTTGGCSPYPRYSHDIDRGPSSPESTESQESSPPPGAEFDEGLLGRIIDDYIGTPYRKGGSNFSGIDCSNLMRNIFFEYDGRSLAADAKRMYRAGRSVDRTQLNFGDLVFFAFGSRGASHVGLYIGNGRFVHASESRGVVVSQLDEKTYREAYLGSRRLD